MCRARCGGPRTPSTTTDANLDCGFVEDGFFTATLEEQNRNELVTRLVGTSLAVRGS